MANFEGKFGSSRAGTWIENGIGSNRTKKPKGTKKSTSDSATKKRGRPKKESN